MGIRSTKAVVIGTAVATLAIGAGVGVSQASAPVVAGTGVRAAVDPGPCPRIRVITDNDYSGDPDGLVQLAHLLLSPSVDIRAVVG